MYSLATLDVGPVFTMASAARTCADESTGFRGVRAHPAGTIVAGPRRTVTIFPGSGQRPFNRSPVEKVGASPCALASKSFQVIHVVERRSRFLLSLSALLVVAGCRSKEAGCSSTVATPSVKLPRTPGACPFGRPVEVTYKFSGRSNAARFPAENTTGVIGPLPSDRRRGRLMWAGRSRSSEVGRHGSGKPGRDD